MTNHYMIGVRVLALIGALTFTSLGAQAADTVIGFDDLPPNTVVTNQYASAGVVFEAPPGCRVPARRTRQWPRATCRCIRAGGIPRS